MVRKLQFFVLVGESCLKMTTLRGVVMVRTRRRSQLSLLQESLVVSEHGIMICKEFLGVGIIDFGKQGQRCHCLIWWLRMRQHSDHYYIYTCLPVPFTQCLHCAVLDTPNDAKTKIDNLGSLNMLAHSVAKDSDSEDIDTKSQ